MLDAWDTRGSHSGASGKSILTAKRASWDELVSSSSRGRWISDGIVWVCCLRIKPTNTQRKTAPGELQRASPHGTCPEPSPHLVFLLSEMLFLVQVLLSFLLPKSEVFLLLCFVVNHPALFSPWFIFITVNYPFFFLSVYCLSFLPEFKLHLGRHLSVLWLLSPQLLE